MDNHFALFQMPASFDIDIGQLESAFRELQGRVHPDRFAAASDVEKRVAMQWATRANEAYQTLKHPIRRASYLCELNDVDLGIESNTAMPPAFLMQQMEWREALDEARDAKDMEGLERLERELAEVRRERLSQVSSLFSESKFEEAGALVRQLMFLERFGEDVGRAFEAIEV